MTRNQIDFAKHKEDQRHNLEMESQGRYSLQETAQHNRAQESIGRSNVGLGYANLGELSRHNRQQEAVNWFTAENLAYLQGEQARYYDELRNKTQSEVGVQRGNLAVNAANSITNLRSVLETGRHNLATEGETFRSNTARERIQNWGVVAQLRQAGAAEERADAASRQATVSENTQDTTNLRNLGGIIGIWRGVQ